MPPPPSANVTDYSYFTLLASSILTERQNVIPIIVNAIRLKDLYFYIRVLTLAAVLSLDITST